MFSGLSTTYSLVNVVSEHIKMILKAGHELKILVCEDCPDSERFGPYNDKRIEWIKITNRLDEKQIRWYDYSKPHGKVHNDFYKEAEVIADDFYNNLKDTDICMMHDIHYQGWHLIHNIAIRMTQKKLSQLKFIAFTHSLPVGRPLKSEEPFLSRYNSMPNTLYAYPTVSGISALAKQYNVPEGKCRVVYNTYSLIEDLSETVKKVNNSIDLLSCDILIVYPGRLTQSKKFEKVAALAGTIKRETELSVSVVFCDFPSSDIESDEYKKFIKSQGKLSGIDNQDMIFTSDIGFLNGIPRKSVLELMGLSNLFICPSFSESFGLTVLEAAAKGNFLVLNEAVPALEELGKKLHAYFMRWDARNFGFDTQESYSPSEKDYYSENAKRIVNLMRENSVLYAKKITRQVFSPDWVWKNQLEPIILSY